MIRTVVAARRDHLGLRHARMLTQHMGDFARLDPVAANLDLIVRPADEHDRTVGAPACAVAAAIEPLTTAARVRHETLGRQARPPKVATRHAGAAQIQFTFDTGRDGFELRVENLRIRVRQRPADRHFGGKAVFSDLGGQHADGGLRRAVVVENPAAGLERTNPLDQRCRQRFAAEHERVRGQHVGCAFRLQQRAEMARHDLQDIDPIARHVVGKTARIEGAAGVGQIERRAAAQRAEQHGVAKIGRDGRHHRHAQIVAPRKALDHALRVIGQRAMTHQHAFGLAGRTGCVNQVGGLLWLDDGRDEGVIGCAFNEALTQ